MSDIKSAEYQKASRFLDLAVYTASTCIMFTLVLLLGRLLPKHKSFDPASYSILQTVGMGCAPGLFMGYIHWADLYPDHLAYLDNLTTRIKTKLRVLWARLLAGPIAVYQFCTGSYLGAAIGSVPFGIAGCFVLMWIGGKALPSFSDYPIIIIGGALTGAPTGMLLHSHSRLHLRWYWVPATTVMAGFLAALLSEQVIRAGCFLWAAKEYGDPVQHWWDVRLSIYWWTGWTNRFVAAAAATAVFLHESKQGTGSIWSLKTARNGLLTIGMVGGEGWRSVKELALAALAGGAWWAAWHFGLVVYQLNVPQWQMIATVAITLAAVPFIAFKLGLAIEHLMRAGAAIMPPIDSRPPVTPRMGGAGTPADAGAAGGGLKRPVSLDEREY